MNAWSPPKPPPIPSSPPLDLGAIDRSDLQHLADADGDNTPAVMTPGGSTPFRRGFVKNISGKWAEFHASPIKYVKLTASGRKVEDTRPDSATRMGMNSFTRRRQLIEERVRSPPKPKGVGGSSSATFDSPSFNRDLDELSPNFRQSL